MTRDSLLEGRFLQSATHVAKVVRRHLSHRPASDPARSVDHEARPAAREAWEAVVNGSLWDDREAAAKAQQIQHGFEPAETIPQLVDAIRQDTAGIGACVSSIRFLAETRGDVPRPVLEWVERLAAHAERLNGKCTLALSARDE